MLKNVSCGLNPKKLGHYNILKFESIMHKSTISYLNFPLYSLIRLFFCFFQKVLYCIDLFFVVTNPWIFFGIMQEGNMVCSKVSMTLEQEILVLTLHNHLSLRFFISQIWITIIPLFSTWTMVHKYKINHYCECLLCTVNLSTNANFLFKIS